MKYRIAAFTAALAAAPAFAMPTAILQDSGNAPNSFADGIDGTLQFDRFDRPTKSGTGNYWIMLVRVGDGNTEALITGSGTSYNLVAVENVTEFEPGRTWGSSDRYADINSSGDWVHIGNLNGGATDDDEVIYAGSFDGSVLSIPFREGQTIATGDTLGSANYGPGITDSGEISFGWSSPSSTSDVSYYTANGTNAVLRNGDTFFLTVPDRQVTFSTASFSGRNAFQTTSDGSSYFAMGSINDGGTDLRVVVDNGDLRSIQGSTNGGKVIEQAFGEQNVLQDDGTWLSRVLFADDTGGALRNGMAIVATGNLVSTDNTFPGERFSNVPWTASSDTTLAIATRDSSGNRVFGGFTDNPNPDLNFVWVYNNTYEILRTGDQIDLDADGTLDDAFIYTPNLASASPPQLGGFLADDDWFYTVVAWRSADGQTTGDAFIRVSALRPACSPADLSSGINPGTPDGILTGADFFEFLSRFQAGDLSVDFSSPLNPGVPDGVLTGADFFQFLNLFSQGC